jgi:exodeoxyribonuclease VII small subunit
MKKSASPPSSQSDLDSLSLEDALKELELIVNRMEDPSTPLEKAMEFYGRGMALSKHCSIRLAGFEQQVLLVQKAHTGELKTTPFPEGESPEGHE